MFEITHLYSQRAHDENYIPDNTSNDLNQSKLSFDPILEFITCIEKQSCVLMVRPTSFGLKCNMVDTT